MIHPDVLFAVSQERQTDFQQQAQQVRLAKSVQKIQRKRKLMMPNLHTVIRYVRFTSRRKSVQTCTTCVSNPSHA